MQAAATDEQRIAMNKIEMRFGETKPMSSSKARMTTTALALRILNHPLVVRNLLLLLQEEEDIMDQRILLQLSAQNPTRLHPLLLQRP
jgi:hypothetical protein